MTSQFTGPADAHKPLSLDPLAASGMLEATHRRYLKSLLPLREPTLARALARAVEDSAMLSKPPLLEATPPYATGATLRELIAEGVLDGGFTNLASSHLPLSRPLYQHQEQALRKAQSGRNLVVATGTGSGKTESFLLPILNALTAEHSAGTLGPGVRALLLYPMNALANDQLKRLRQLLADTPQFTFGRYTGDTPEDANRARSQFESLNPGEPVLPNELLSRQEMRQRPPHLLLTNYAMLEYLLLRPADLDLFQGAHAGQWRFIALDEAHVYDGAKAAEVAMLLRRLRDRVGNGAPQCIATSATVGDDESAVVSFAERLFGVPFEWDEDDPGRQDLVRASRVALPEGPFWGPLSAEDYLALAESEKVGTRIVEMAAMHRQSGDDPRALIINEARMAEARRRLAERPVPFNELAAEVFREAPDPAAALGALVTVGSRTRDGNGTAALGARYHQFLRATEGAFACLGAAGPHIALSRHEACTACGAAMFEIGSCRRCGGVYLLGAVHTEDGSHRFVPRLRDNDRRTWLAVGEDMSAADEDDETLAAEVADADSDVAFLCVLCGALHATKRNSCGAQGCTETQLRPVRRLKNKEDSPPVCVTCGARGEATVRRFESGNEAPAAVLSSALYQALPEAPAPDLADQPGGGRKLLLFSDSR
ncbi:DEAD/DEAH box helicase, partial [Actinoplanes sp. NPDC051633]|uniref:DEAD/DEAH box helicase n=1 Tax=Actinoplanes sp. NPDC051633 TaxID=3155670 RepID=UPI00344302D8